MTTTAKHRPARGAKSKRNGRAKSKAAADLPELESQPTAEYPGALAELEVHGVALAGIEAKARERATETGERFEDALVEMVEETGAACFKLAHSFAMAQREPFRKASVLGLELLPLQAYAEKRFHRERIREIEFAYSAKRGEIGQYLKDNRFRSLGTLPDGLGVFSFEYGQFHGEYVGPVEVLQRLSRLNEFSYDLNADIIYDILDS